MCRQARFIEKSQIFRFGFFLAGAEGLGLACPLGRSVLLPMAEVFAPPDTLRVPRVQIIHSQ